MNDSMNVAGNPINNPDSGSPRTRSKFALSYHMYNTERFGEYNVPFVMDCVEGDRVPLRSGGSVQSYTLKAPLMQSITKKKDFYEVPLQAILPRNWELWYANPVLGDDVPDDCGTGVDDFWSKIGNLVVNLRQELQAILAASTPPTNAVALTAIMRFMVTAEYFYSNGSLIASLGCHGARYFHAKNNSTKGRSYSFDRYFDQVLLAVSGSIPWFSFIDGDGFVKYVINDEQNYGDLLSEYACVSLRGFLQYLRDDLNCYIQDVGPMSGSATVVSQFTPFFQQSSVWTFSIDSPEVDYNLSRLWSYQLVCAHFYSNDHVDYVYSAQLYRDLIEYLVTPRLSNGYSPDFFTRNGIRYFYDGMSAHYFSALIVRCTNNKNAFLIERSNPNVITQSDRGYLSALLSYRRSLRFVDYFTGARTRPLAVGDVSVSVNNSKVDVVDISRNIQRQRFFNAVNRFGRKIEEYIKGLSGVNPAPDYHNPLYLAHTSDSIYGTQVENTGADQLSIAQSVTSRLLSNGSRYQFEFSVDRPCVVIGISYYDISRSYKDSCERQLFHMNRFDMFNPFMQFIGDQPVYFDELGTSRRIMFHGNFGYQLRHMEYKQRFNQCAGGFVENLEGYIFKNDDEGRSNGGNQSVDFVHSLNEELDRFYVSLTGYSLGSYFHFIVDNDNSCDASRPMAYAPTIL